MKDESHGGDFISDSDLIPLDHRNAKQTARKAVTSGALPTQGRCGAGRRCPYPEPLSVGRRSAVFLWRKTRILQVGKTNSQKADHGDRK